MKLDLTDHCLCFSLHMTFLDSSTNWLKGEGGGGGGSTGFYNESEAAGCGALIPDTQIPSVYIYWCQFLLLTLLHRSVLCCICGVVDLQGLCSRKCIKVIPPCRITMWASAASNFQMMLWAPLLHLFNNWLPGGLFLPVIGCSVPPSKHHQGQGTQKVDPSSTCFHSDGTTSCCKAQHGSIRHVPLVWETIGLWENFLGRIPLVPEATDHHQHGPLPCFKAVWITTRTGSHSHSSL